MQCTSCTGHKNHIIMQLSVCAFLRTWCVKLYLDDENYNLESNNLRNVLSWYCLKWGIFPQIIHQIVPYAWDFLSIKFYSSVTLKTHTSSGHTMYRHKWGKIGQSDLLIKQGDLSFLLYFLKPTLVGHIYRKFLKKISDNFFFGKIGLNVCFCYQ